MKKENFYKFVGVFLIGAVVGMIFAFPPKVGKASLSNSESASSLSGLGTYLDHLNRIIGGFQKDFSRYLKGGEKKKGPNQQEEKEEKNQNKSLENNRGEKSPSFQLKENNQGEENNSLTQYEETIIRAVKKASPAVVSVVISKYVPVVEEYYVNPFNNVPKEFQPFFNFQIPQYKQKGFKKQEVGGGSGFIISSDGLVVTNKHVVLDKDASYTVLMNNGKKYDAKVLARDPLLDVAILKIKANNLPTLRLGDSDKIMIGQTAIAIGNALGEFRNTVSVGVVSGLSRTITASGSEGFSETIQGVIQTDAAINKGNSGGPLLNSRGEVIGINTAMAQGAQNIGFAIPINQVKKDINSILKRGKIVVPYIGIRYVIINEMVKEEYNLPVDYGALIIGKGDEMGVVPYSPAAKAGLQEGDIILEMNGTKIDEDHSIAYMVRRLNVGDKITLKIMRNGKILTKELVLGER